MSEAPDDASGPLPEPDPTTRSPYSRHGTPAPLAVAAGLTFIQGLLTVLFGLTEVVTYALSVAAILITGVVLIQGYRDTAAIHAKLDEIVVALGRARNEVVGLEHQDPEKITAELERVEREAASGRDRREPEGG